MNFITIIKNFLPPWHIGISLLFVLFILWDKKRKNLSTAQTLSWIIATLILGFAVIPIYFYITHKPKGVLQNSSQPTEPNAEPSAKKSNSVLKRIAFVFFFAPAPFYMCFDSCLGTQLILPLALAWIPVPTIFSFFFPLRWLWHGLFFIPFILVFIPGTKYIDRQPQWITGEKNFYKILLYISYWILITLLWSLIPLETREVWLGQRW